MSKEVELLPLDVTETEKTLSQMIPSLIARPYVEQLLCRERQLSESLALLREVSENISYEPLAEGNSEEDQMRAEGDIILEALHKKIQAFLTPAASKETKP
jgi:hypothetical protein